MIQVLVARGLGGVDFAYLGSIAAADARARIRLSFEERGVQLTVNLIKRPRREDTETEATYCSDSQDTALTVGKRERVLGTQQQQRRGSRVKLQGKGQGSAPGQL